MAIFHLQMQIISRGKGGKSAVAAAAYRAGEKITNERDGVIHDYTSKGGIVHTEVFLPEYAPREYLDRAVLWNEVERIEKAKNSQLAREIELFLPIELTIGQNISLVHGYVKKHFVEQGMCADVCVHDKGDGNPHAHIMQNSAGGKRLETQWKRIANIKTQAKLLTFLTSNGIYDIEQLTAEVEQMHTRQYDVANRIKDLDRRKGKLTEHLANVDVYNQHLAVHRKYKKKRSQDISR